jgi:hypothetical protein
VLGSCLQGAFNRVTVNTGAATGSVTVTSITPVAVTANLGGITTLNLNAPAGGVGWDARIACGCTVHVSFSNATLRVLNAATTRHHH